LHVAVSRALTGRAIADGRDSTQPRSLYRSRDDLLEWKEEPLQQLTGNLLRGIWSFIASVNDFPQSQLLALTLQARAWFTIVTQDGCVPAASLPLTSWCAIYCVEAPEAAADRLDSGVMRLYESRLGTMFTDATNSVMRLPFTPGHYTWRPVPGQMVIFPASITHEIALIRATGQLMIVTVRARFVAEGQQGVSRW
jgi:hypothetical protein